MSSTCQREMSLASSTKLGILRFDTITSMKDLLRRLYELLIGSDYGWFEDEDASESRATGDQVEKLEKGILVRESEEIAMKLDLLAGDGEKEKLERRRHETML